MKFANFLGINIMELAKKLDLTALQIDSFSKS